MTLKKSVLANMIVSLIFGVLLGMVLLIIAENVLVTDLIKWALIITGIIIIITNIPSLVAGIVNINTKVGVLDVVFSAFGILFGVLMIIMQNSVITILVAVYLVIFPIVRILIAPDKANQLKSQWLKILIGILLWVFLPGIMGAANSIVLLLIKIAGWAVMGISIISFIISLITFIGALKKIEKLKSQTEPDFVETTAEEK